MARKEYRDWTTVAIKRSILKRLDKMKIHPNQSYSAVVEKLTKLVDKVDKEG